jgi:hypothetical protein
MRIDREGDLPEEKPSQMSLGLPKIPQDRTAAVERQRLASRLGYGSPILRTAMEPHFSQSFIRPRVKSIKILHGI